MLQTEEQQQQIKFKLQAVKEGMGNKQNGMYVGKHLNIKLVEL